MLFLEMKRNRIQEEETEGRQQQAKGKKQDIF